MARSACYQTNAVARPTHAGGLPRCPDAWIGQREPHAAASAVRRKQTPSRQAATGTCARRASFSLRRLGSLRAGLTRWFVVDPVKPLRADAETDAVRMKYRCGL